MEDYGLALNFIKIYEYEIIANIDTDEIAAKNAVLETKLDEALEYSRDIKNGLKMI